MLAKIKAFFKNHKNKILAATSFIAAGYFFYKFFSKDDSEVELSTFLKAV
jgi:hypothetical protein